MYKEIKVQKRQLYTYSQHDLHAFRETLLKNRIWKQLDYDTCKIVYSLRLNRRGCRAGKNKMKAIPNHDNLISFVTRRVIEQKIVIVIANKLKLSTVNIQSIKSKDNDLFEYLLESKTDLCVLTKKWLSDENEEYGVWVSCTHLDKAPFKISTSNRKTTEVEVLP